MTFEINLYFRVRFIDVVSVISNSIAANIDESVQIILFDKQELNSLFFLLLSCIFTFYRFSISLKFHLMLIDRF